MSPRRGSAPGGAGRGSAERQALWDRLPAGRGHRARIRSRPAFPGRARARSGRESARRNRARVPLLLITSFPPLPLPRRARSPPSRRINSTLRSLDVGEYIIHGIMECWSCACPSKRGLTLFVASPFRTWPCARGAGCRAGQGAPQLLLPSPGRSVSAGDASVRATVFTSVVALARHGGARAPGAAVSLTTAAARGAQASSPAWTRSSRAALTRR